MKAKKNWIAAAGIDQIKASPRIATLRKRHLARDLHGELDPDPFGALLYEDCIERAKDIHCGGAKYTLGPGILFTGIADVINSMAAIKSLIFDEKKLRWDELLDALKNNFEQSGGRALSL